MWNNGQNSDDYEKMQFYYYPDHLGSSSYITNLDGEVSQHIEYVPYGEVFIDELELTRKSATAGKANCNKTWNTPYRFNDCAYEGRGKLDFQHIACRFQVFFGTLPWGCA